MIDPTGSDSIREYVGLGIIAHSVEHLSPLAGLSARTASHLGMLDAPDTSAARRRPRPSASTSEHDLAAASVEHRLSAARNCSEHTFSAEWYKGASMRDRETAGRMAERGSSYARA